MRFGTVTLCALMLAGSTALSANTNVVSIDAANSKASSPAASATAQKTAKATKKSHMGIAGSTEHGTLPLSFMVARSLLYEMSYKRKASSANVRSKEEARDSLKTLGGPTVTATAVQIAGQKEISFNSSVPVPVLGTIPIALSENVSLNGPRAMVTATWPIYTGGKITAAQEASKYAVDEALAEKRATGENLDAELAGYYFGLQLAVSIEKLQKAMLTQQDAELKRAIKFEKQGMISKVERMSVQVARDNTRRDYLKAQDNAKVARLQLQRLLRDDDFGKLTTPLFVIKKPLQPLKYWVDLSLANNPQIAVIQAKAQQANQGVEASKGAWKPDVFAFGQYNFIKHYQTIVEPNWIAGVGVNFTLWDAKDRRASIRSAEATLEQAEAGRAEAVNQIREATEVAWLRTNNAIEQYKLSASTVSLALENLKLKNKGFGEGMSTALDVTQARAELLKAEVGRRLAAFEFVSNYAMLHAIAGKMSDFMTAVNQKDVIVEQ